jgi:threonine dehydrogenase-like Zn-dependent dehydrogenase
LAAAIRVVKQLQGLSVSSIAVVGPGRLGLLIAKVLMLAGYQVMVLGRSESSLVLPGQWRLGTALSRDIPDNCYDCVVDASGRVAGFQQALRIVKPRGTIVLKSTFTPTEPVDLAKVVVQEVNVLGSRCGPFAEALMVLQQKTVPVETMVNGHYRLQQGLAAIEHAAHAGVRKILLKP